MIQIGTKIQWVVTNYWWDIRPLFKKFRKNRQLLELSATFVELPKKIPFKNSWIRSRSGSLPKSNRLVLVIRLILPKNFIKTRRQRFVLSCWQTNKQRQKHNLLGGGKSRRRVHDCYNSCLKCCLILYWKIELGPKWYLERFTQSDPNFIVLRLRYLARRTRLNNALEFTMSNFIFRIRPTPNIITCAP